MPIEPIGGVSATAATGYLPAAGRAEQADPAVFAASLTGAVDNVTALQSESSALAVKAVTGDLDDIHDATIASTRAAVTLELVAGIRNKAVDAFNEIMRMQA